MVPLFNQFGRGRWSLPQHKRSEKSLSEFRGRLLTARALHRVATECGYARGNVLSNGWFFDYIKALPGLGLEVRCGFSGRRPPEKNRTVALTYMEFRRIPNPAIPTPRPEELLYLDELPPILLSDCYHDLKMMAAAGTGFHRKWKSIVATSGAA